MRERAATIGALVAVLATPGLAAEAPAEGTHYAQRTEYRAPRAATAPVVDGVADEAAWTEAAWQPIAQRWLGPEYTPEDFAGRFKVVWTPERIYLLAEIVDDVLIDTHRDPLVQYWDDDTLEIFVDEDYSGGEHRFNHNAFAYHMSLDNQAIDMGTDERAMAWVHDEIGRAVGLPASMGGIPLDVLGATAWGLRYGTEVAARFCELDLKGARLVVQGFGAVGRHTARFLAQRDRDRHAVVAGLLVDMFFHQHPAEIVGAGQQPDAKRGQLLREAAVAALAADPEARERLAVESLLIDPADARLSASMMTRSSIRLSFTGAHVD